MVVLHIKQGDESQFLLETSVQATVSDTLKRIVMIFNGRMKIYRICTEMEMLAEHGPSLPFEMQGLTEDQIQDLKLEDEWAEICISSGGFCMNKDVLGKRNGRQPVENMRQVLHKTIQEAKGIISKEQVKSNVSLTEQHIYDALDILKGAVMIVYPQNLPPHDPIRKELENQEDLESTDKQKVLDLALTQLWFAGKEVQCGKKLLDYVGKNEKTKVIMKVQHRGHGAPGREPLLTEDQQKVLMMKEFKRREELKRLEEDDDDSYLDSTWADSSHLKRSFQGLNNISWKPH